MKGNVLWLTEILNTYTHTHTQTQRAFIYDHSSVGKEFTCSSGDPGSIHGWGRSPREGIVYPLQYSWASLVTQLVKNLSAMWETWVWSLGWKGLLEKRLFMDQKYGFHGEFHGLYSPQGLKELDSTERLSLSHSKLS